MAKKLIPLPTGDSVLRCDDDRRLLHLARRECGQHPTDTGIGIQAVSTIFGKCFFDAEKCVDGIQALRRPGGANARDRAGAEKGLGGTHRFMVAAIMRRAQAPWAGLALRKSLRPLG